MPDRFLNGPPNVALSHLFAAAKSKADARAAIDAMLADGATRARAEQMLALWQRFPDAYQRVRAVLAVASRSADSAWGDVFDAAVARDPRAAVALYCLGDADLLRQATDELIERMRQWDLLGPARIVLDFGCGTGRVAAAVAPYVSRVLGVDASARMVDVARAAVARYANAAIIQAGSLADLRDDRFDAVLAIDSVPYVVESGDATALWSDVTALLNPGGVFLIYNYSYRDDLARDRAEVIDAAARHHLTVARNGTSDLSLWDGRAFLLRKPN